MRVRLVAVALVLCGACLLTSPRSPAPAEPQPAEAIDFDALRAQAAVALETLQQSRERQLASVARSAF
ncbi:MAG TPA: hypothetical protein VFN84_09175 [Pseudolabrys sp.]|nr:hypothetical protein [Pseudolabrys sp.]